MEVPMESLERVVLLHDGDIFAYRAAAVTDGRQYNVQWYTPDGVLEVQSLKYKKDADVRAAEVGGTVELEYIAEPESHALHIVKSLLSQVKIDLSSRIKDFADVHEFDEHFLTSKGSFREKIVPSYKANRETLRRPPHLQASKDYLTKNYGAITQAGELEADDLLGIAMTHWQAKGYTPICVSIDKDLLQISGWHWNFVRKELVYVTERQGYRSFYRQLLTGDATDGIIGIHRMGPKTAAKLIDKLTDPKDMYKVCMEQWLKAMPQESLETEDEWIARVVKHVHLNARLLYLLREYDAHWIQP